MREIHHAQAEDLIKAERQRQRETIGYTDESDDRHVRGELRSAAECYFAAALKESGATEGNVNPTARVPSTWPWSPGSWRPFSGKVRMLTKAGALYVAEKERLKRKGQRDAHHLMLLEIVEERIREVTEELNKALAPPREERFRDHGKTFANLADLNRDGGEHVRMMELGPRKWEGPQEGSTPDDVMGGANSEE
jgi:hypothetical protein